MSVFLHNKPFILPIDIQHKGLVFVPILHPREMQALCNKLRDRYNASPIQRGDFGNAVSHVLDTKVRTHTNSRTRQIAGQKDQRMTKIKKIETRNKKAQTNHRKMKNIHVKRLFTPPTVAKDGHLRVEAGFLKKHCVPFHKNVSRRTIFTIYLVCFEV